MNTEENKSSSDSLTRRNKQQKVLLIMEYGQGTEESNKNVK